MQWLKLQPVLSTVLLAAAEELKKWRDFWDGKSCSYLFRIMCRVYEDCTTLIMEVLWGWKFKIE